MNCSLIENITSWPQAFGLVGVALSMALIVWAVAWLAKAVIEGR